MVLKLRHEMANPNPRSYTPCSDNRARLMRGPEVVKQDTISVYAYMPSEIFEVVIVALGHLVGVCISLAVVLGVRVEALRVAGVPDRGDDGPAVATG